MSTAPSPVRALLVDDDPMILALLQAFLGSRGYAIDTCGNGEEALERLATGGFNLVVTDRNMPRMDGLSLVRAIRSQPSEAYVYCMMLTSSGDEGTLVAAMEAGVDDFIAKPLRPAELGARLRAAERVLALEAGLARRNRELEQAYGQLSRELEFARGLQLGQLPAPTSHGRVRLDWMFEASSFVGGDMFDYFGLVDGRHLCFWLADVSGHGVAAAMMAFNTQHQLLATTQQVPCPMLRQGGTVAEAAVAAVTEYNRRFLDMKDTSLYLTLIYGLVDRETGAAALVQAGHPPALLSASPGAPFLPLGDGGVPVGILAEPGYEAATVTLGAGSRLVLYSDGITDCTGPAGEPFGQERLQDALAQPLSGGLPATCHAVGQALRAWRGSGFEDDVTLLALELR